MSYVNPYYSSTHWRQLRRAVLQRDGYRCYVQGCQQRAVIVDHIERRGDSPTPTALDVPENCRSLCTSHDAQVRQMPRQHGYERRNGGRFRVKGADAEGWPLDPGRR